MIVQGAIAWGTLRRETPAWTLATPCAAGCGSSTPCHPKTKRTYRRPYFWLVPLVVVAAVSLLVSHVLFAATMLVPFPERPRHEPLLPQLRQDARPHEPGARRTVVAAGRGARRRLSHHRRGRGAASSADCSCPGCRAAAGWLTNALLSSLHYLYIPWMIPGRLVTTIGAIWAARRYRSNWIPLFVRTNEVVGLTLATLVGVTSFTLPPITTPISDTSHRHRAMRTSRQGAALDRLAHMRSGEAVLSVDLRAKDVSALDLRGRGAGPGLRVFDSHTRWPAADRLPPDFDPARILAENRNPGLGLRALHAQGVTGRGVGIGIIDMPLLSTIGVRFAAALERITRIRRRDGAGPPSPHMHGSAVASIAVGRTVGVAPEADLYFIATPVRCPRAALAHAAPLRAGDQAFRGDQSRPARGQEDPRDLALQGWGDAALGCHDAEAAVALARAEGIVFFSVTHDFAYGGLGRPPRSEPDSFDAYVLGLDVAGRQVRRAHPDEALLHPHRQSHAGQRIESGCDGLLPHRGATAGGRRSWRVSTPSPPRSTRRSRPSASSICRCVTHGDTPQATAERRMASLVLDPVALIDALRK